MKSQRKKKSLKIKERLEPVWLRGRGCVFLKMHLANVWLRKKTVCCAWVPQFIAYEMQGNEKQ
jgi:hypothetical protein